jgi:hypothetical protein
MGHPNVADGLKRFLFYLPVEVAFAAGQEESFIHKIEDHVTSFKRDRILA